MNMDIIEEFLNGRMYTNPTTRQRYREKIDRYFSVLNKKPESYRNADIQTMVTDLPQAYLALDKKLERTSTKGIIYTVKPFLIYLQPEIKRHDIWDTVKARFKGVKKRTEDYVPEPEEMQKILQHADLRLKAMILLQTSSGMRIGEVLNLEEKDIHFDENPVRIHLTQTKGDASNHRDCFITDEAVQSLKEYLKRREEYITTATARTHKDKRGNTDTNKLFPMNRGTFYKIFHRFTEKAGQTERAVTNIRKFHPHCLRQYFRTYLGNPDLAEELMGHEGYLSQYRNWTLKKKGELYAKLMKNISIYDRNADLTEIKEQMEEKLESHDQIYRKLIRNMQEQITELTMKVVSYEEGIPLDKLKEGMDKAHKKPGSVVSV